MQRLWGILVIFLVLIGLNLPQPAAAMIFWGLVGEDMDPSDEHMIDNIMEQNMKGDIRTWFNPHTGNHFWVRIYRSFEMRNRPCQNFKMIARSSYYQDIIWGQACRTQAGHWYLRRENNAGW